MRTLPYVKAWSAKYRQDGLLVIGVHTPEFGFEKDKDNVERAVRDLGITYPVVMDNQYEIWNAYKNTVLACAIFDGCAGPATLSAFRRRRVSGNRDNDTNFACRSASRRQCGQALNGFVSLSVISRQAKFFKEVLPC